MLEHAKRPTIVGLEEGLADFDRRLDETRRRSQVLEAKTAAFHLHYEGAGLSRPTSAAPSREKRLFPSPAPR